MYSKYKIHFLPHSSTLYLSKPSSFCSLTSQQICYMFPKLTLLFSSSLTFHILLSLARMSSIISFTCLMHVYPFSKIQLNSLLCEQSIATPHPRHLSREHHTLLCAISVSSMTIILSISHYSVCYFCISKERGLSYSCAPVLKSDPQNKKMIQDHLSSEIKGGKETVLFLLHERMFSQ